MVRIGRIAVLVAAVLVGVSSLASAAGKLFANAVVKTVSATSLTATAGGKDMTFSVNQKTTVVGKGIGTKGDSKGGKPAITDLLKEGDHVSVTYTEGATPLATKVQVISGK